MRLPRPRIQPLAVLGVTSVLRRLYATHRPRCRGEYCARLLNFRLRGGENVPNGWPVPGSRTLRPALLDLESRLANSSR
jgi:hypothetical protein